MPRGVPKSGFRLTAKRKAAGKFSRESLKAVQVEPLAIVQTETDDEIKAKLAERFDILQVLTEQSLTGDVRSLIVAGPAGLGKSFTVEKALEAWDPNGINYSIVKGFVRATGLYKKLYQTRLPGQVLVFDDADSIFFDDITLSLLKAVCDTSDRRRVSWLAETTMADEETGDLIPTSFEYEGSIIFITNLDFDAMIDKSHKLGPHLQAMMSRSHYVDLAMKTRRDYMIRIQQVVEMGLLSAKGLTEDQAKDVMGFLEKHQDRLRELSLRMALKVAAVRKSDRANWEAVARVTTLKAA